MFTEEKGQSCDGAFVKRITKRTENELCLKGIDP